MEATRTKKSAAQAAAKPTAEKSSAKSHGAQAGTPLFLQPSSGDRTVANDPSQILQREPEEDETLQPKFLQRMEEEEPLQAKLIQRMEEEEPLQAKFLQRAEEEEPIQPKLLQRTEDEEPLQAKHIQRAEINEEPLQAKTLPIQPKLVVGAPNDPFEQEADAAADKVMRQATSPHPISPTADQPTLQPKSLSSSGATHLPGKLKTAGSGNPLPTQIRDRIEPILGADLSSVRIHNQPADQQAAKSLHAKAFTHKNHIWLGANQSPTDLKLMAHEATHVVQQTSGSAPVQKLQLKADSTSVGWVEERNPTPPATTPNLPQPEPAHTPIVPPAESAGTSEPSSNNDPAAEPPPTDTQTPESISVAEANKPQDLAPKSPETDPAFQSVIGKSKQTAKQQKTHAPAAAASSAAQAAAVSPATEIASKAQANQVGEMQQAETPGFDKAAFKKKLLDAIASAAPKTLEEADEFKKDNKLGPVKDQMSNQVSEEKTTSQKPLADKTAAPPDTSAVKPKPVTPLTPAPIGKQPSSIGAKKAAPKPKGHSEIEAPLQQSSQQLDQQMADASLTEPQLQQSNEPTFQTALTAKQSAQTHAATAGPTYRQTESAQLSSAQADANTTTRSDLRAMHGSRAEQLRQVNSDQTATKSKDEAARTKIAADIQRIYNATKTKVETRLSELDGKVTKAFDQGAKAAQTVFEDYVAKRMKAYKDKRYEGWLVGTGRWIKDKILSLPEEVNIFYVEGRNLYIKAMDTVIDGVINIIATELTGAKKDIADGRKEVDKYVAQLPDDLKKVGEDAAKDIQSEFDSLVESVDSKQNELVESLAKKYTEKLKAVDAQIAAMKEANKGLVDKAVDAVKGVIQTVQKLKQKLLSVLADAAAVIENIITDPIGFLSNLIKGIKQGLDSFVAKIWEHLQSGLIGWLTGAMGSVGITIPKDIFSLSGIFDLVTQILGLTWDYVRSKAVKLLGEPVFAAAEKTFEVFMLIKEKGLAGIWEQVKEQFSDLKEKVIDEIKSMVIVQVIQAGVKWILGLLNPASAFVKACLLIYDIVMFFVNQGSQILELVKAVVDGVKAIASGSVGAVAKAIEGALVRALPVVIGFLAAIAGVSGLAGKVQKIVKRIRNRIDKAIDKVILKAKKAIKGKKGKADKGEIPKKLSAQKTVKIDKPKEALLKEIDKIKSGELIYQASTKEPKKATRKLLQKHPKSKLNKGTKILSLEALKQNPFEQASSVKKIGEELFNQTGLTKIFLNKTEKGWSLSGSINPTIANLATYEGAPSELEPLIKDIQQHVGIIKPGIDFFKSICREAAKRYDAEILFITTKDKTVKPYRDMTEVYFKKGEPPQTFRTTIVTVVDQSCLACLNSPGSSKPHIALSSSAWIEVIRRVLNQHASNISEDNKTYADEIVGAGGGTGGAAVDTDKQCRDCENKQSNLSMLQRADQVENNQQPPEVGDEYVGEQFARANDSQRLQYTKDKIKDVADEIEYILLRRLEKKRDRDNTGKEIFVPQIKEGDSLYELANDVDKITNFTTELRTEALKKAQPTSS